ncbi:outer membrane beta-barrel protein [Enterovibrio norvegicus]|uniref:outer membrane beta-barrel protein n=1 Tax=Enterovibrio norvegicus TaxID=188144 RepID=UPI003550854C
MNFIKKALVLLAVTAPSAAYANDNDLYIGIDYLSSEYDVNDGTARTYDRAGGFNINMGYLLPISKDIDFGFEASINDFGDGSISENGSDVEASLSAIVLSFKPTYYFSDSGFSVSGVLGAGSYSYDAEGTQNGTTTSISDSEFGYTYGIEAGYSFSQNVMVTAGYKAAKVEFADDIDADIDTFNLGVKFRF